MKYRSTVLQKIRTHWFRRMFSNFIWSDHSGDKRLIHLTTAGRNSSHGRSAAVALISCLSLPHNSTVYSPRLDLRPEGRIYLRVSRVDIIKERTAGKGDQL